jgi:UPF0716 family protein affecting phage T7 exclusion
MKRIQPEILGTCLNWKVIGTLVAVAGGVLLLAPGLAAGVIPLLLLAICPLSMLLMGRMMMNGHEEPERSAKVSARGEQSPEVREELARLKEEIRDLRAQPQSQTKRTAEVGHKERGG